MYFKSYASEVYPEAKWTGGSEIHASRAAHLVAPLSMDQKRLILKSIKDTGFISYISRCVNKTTPGVEWLMGAEDFFNLILLDFNRVINGMATTETKNRLVNPQTGNRFHRITLNEGGNIVGGIRVWIEPATFVGTNPDNPGESYYTEGVSIGFRYRLEAIVPEGTEASEHAMKIREKAQQQIIEQSEEMVELKEWIAQEEKPAVQLEQYVKEQF